MSLVAADLVLAFLVQQDHLHRWELRDQVLRATRLDQAAAGGANPLRVLGLGGELGPKVPGRLAGLFAREAHRAGKPADEVVDLGCPSWGRRGAAAVPPRPGCGRPACPCADPPAEQGRSVSAQ